MKYDISTDKTPLAETRRSLDGKVEWIDNSHVIHGFPSQRWAKP